MARALVEDAVKLPARMLAEFARGAMCVAFDTADGSPWVIFSARWEGSRDAGDAWLDYKLHAEPLKSIYAERFPSRIGRGSLWRFWCPDCNRRGLQDLYFTHARPWFACRQCHRLSYRSQRFRSALEKAEVRMIQAAQKVDPSIDPDAALGGLPERPRGMPHRKYARLEQRYERAEVAWLRCAIADADSVIASVGSELTAAEDRT